MKATLHNSCATPLRNGKFIRTIAPDRGTALSPFTFPSSPFPRLKHQHASVRDPRCTATTAGVNALRADLSWQLDFIVTFNDMLLPGQKKNTAGERRASRFWHLGAILCSDIRPNQKYGVREQTALYFPWCFFPPTAWRFLSFVKAGILVRVVTKINMFVRPTLQKCGPHVHDYSTQTPTAKA